jgi:hypothetical protein
VRSRHTVTSASTAGIAVVAAAALVTAACGTRAGNPKKPGEDPPKPGQVVALPLIDFTVPEPVTSAGGGSELQLLPFGAYADAASPSTAAESFDGSTIRARLVVASLNALFGGLNAIEPKLGESFAHQAAQGEVVGVIEAGEADEAAGPEATPTSYTSTFCFEGQVFLTVDWTADSKRIAAVRDLTVNPFAGDDAAAGIGSPMLGDALYDATGAFAVLESRIDGTLSKGDPVHKDDGPRAIVDLARIAKVEGGGFVTHGIADFRDPAAATFTPELRTAGAIGASGVRRILAHHNGMPVLCKTAFDEADTANPGWCAGVELKPGENPRLLPETERDALWDEIGAAAGVPKATELRRVEFGAGAKCPTPPP